MPTDAQTYHQRIAGLVGLGENLTPDQAMASVGEFYAPGQVSRRFWDSLAEPSRRRHPLRSIGVGNVRLGLGNASRSYLQGAASAWLPIEPLGDDAARTAYELAEGAAGKIGGFLARGDSAAKELAKESAIAGFRKFHGSLSSTTRLAGRIGLRGASKLIGPVMGTYRLGTEVDIASQGYFGAASKATRIIGEEAAWTGGAVLGMTLGPAIAGGLFGAKAGAAAGTAIAPGVGTAIGLVAGLAIGAIGAYAWNKMVDVAEMPIRMADAGYKFFRDLGARSNRLELGGNLSAGNRTRAAWTMRQRQLMEMNRSGENARSLLGREASFMHLR